MSRIIQQWNITIYIGDKEVMMKGGESCKLCCIFLVEQNTDADQHEFARMCW